MVVPTLSLLLPLGAYGALTAVGVDGGKAGVYQTYFVFVLSRFLCIFVDVGCWVVTVVVFPAV